MDSLKAKDDAFILTNRLSEELGLRNNFLFDETNQHAKKGGQTSRDINDDIMIVNKNVVKNDRILELSPIQACTELNDGDFEKLAHKYEYAEESFLTTVCLIGGRFVYRDVRRSKKSSNDLKNMRHGLPRFIVLHYSPFKAVWDWIILLLVIYTAVFTPYTAAFLLNEEKTTRQQNLNPRTRVMTPTQQADTLVMIDLIVDMTFIIDILINFRTTYVLNGEYVQDPQRIASNYLRGWFLVDAMAAIPFDMLLFGSEPDKITSTGVLKTIRLLRLLRVARRIHLYMEYGAAVMLLLMATFTLVAHWLACIFYAIAYVEKDSLHARIGWIDTLARSDENHKNITLQIYQQMDIQKKYITAMYFTVTTLTSIGFGNVAANTNAEKIFTIISMMIGSLMSAAIFGNVTSIMLRLSQLTKDFHENLIGVKEFIKFHHIPKTLAHRITESFQSSWDYTNGIDMNNVLRSFPECLQADICLHMNRKLLKRCKAFRGASEGCLRALSMKFKAINIPTGDTLVHSGDIVESLFFVARGSLEISLPETITQLSAPIVMAVLGNDDTFGDNPQTNLKELMNQSIYTVRATSYTTLNRISMIDLSEILSIYPEWSPKFLQNFNLTFNLSSSKPLKSILDRTGQNKLIPQWILKDLNSEEKKKPSVEEKEPIRDINPWEEVEQKLSYMQRTLKKCECNFDTAMIKMNETLGKLRQVYGLQ